MDYKGIMELKIKAGDKVKAKSGSKEYTVIAIDGNKIFVAGRLTPLSLFNIEKLNVNKKENKVLAEIVSANRSAPAMPSYSGSDSFGSYTPSKVKHTEVSLEERYGKIVGNISSMTKEVNDSTNLDASKELQSLFSKARLSLEQYEVIKAKDTSGWLSKFMSSDKKKDRELKTITQNIDYMFDMINQKYQDLVNTGTKFQNQKVDMTKQYNDLLELLDESNKAVQQYIDDGEMVPMQLISTNSQITASCETYKAKLLKIEAGITMTTGAVISLGSKLPNMRAGIADEAAYASLLDSVSNVYGMISGTAELMLGIADLTSEELFKKVDGIMQSQINDNTTIRYLESRQHHTAKLSDMIIQNAEALDNKLLLESGTVKRISLEDSTGKSRERLAQLNEDYKLPAAPELRF